MTTQHCAECGTRAEPGQSFCDSCGAVLGWDRAGARASSPAATAGGAASRDAADRPSPAPRSLPDKPPGDRATTGEPDRAAARVTGPEPHRPEPPSRTDPPHQGSDGASHAPGDHSAYDPDARNATDGSTPTVPMPPAPAAGPADGLPDSDTERVRSLLVPVADPEAPAPAPPGVAPVLPGRPDADRPQVRAPGPGQDFGGPPCRWCSTPNRPDRHFCGRCAMPLAAETAEPSVHRPWWRRLFGRGSETPWAGERPPLRRVFDRIGTWVAAVLAMTAVILGVIFIPDGVQATRDHFAKRAPVAPDGMRASRSFPGHQPKLAFDKRSNTWWGPGVSEAGRGEWIEVSFSEPTRLLDVLITPGVSGRPDKLGDSALPHRIRATVTTKDGKTTNREITLDQGAGAQRRPFRIVDVLRVRFTLESAYAASGDKQVAIAEIEFFGRSSSNGI
ncbi:NADase-type glycan-binding domain-containing protein [Streptomyces crystallinus]|uniref:Zinc ribbon domain-containing protein n=1 Tax=Streptomyces crystallinus TaxID=68191 RepID=A0ABP3QBS3_9ACTN